MFLTVKEAIDMSGMSQTTIHRLCQKYEGTKYVQKENNKYLVDKEFLMDKYPIENDTFSTSNSANPQNGESLLKSLIEKNHTITSLTIENNGLNQKLSEKIEELQKLQNDLHATKQMNEELGKSVSMSMAKAAVSEVLHTESPDSKALIRYQLIGITISVLVVASFIFAMYYFTN